jgi:hypothetical protein
MNRITRSFSLDTLDTTLGEAQSSSAPSSSARPSSLIYEDLPSVKQQIIDWDAMDLPSDDTTYVYVQGRAPGRSEEEKLEQALGIISFMRQNCQGLSFKWFLEVFFCFR